MERAFAEREIMSPFHPGEMVDVPSVTMNPKTGETFASTTPAKVIMARLPGKTLLDFGDVIATCENKRLCREKPNRRRG
jgi:hypothetical protein